MPLSDLTPADLIGAVLAFVLTLMALSYLLGDNPLFRLAAHLFVGAAAGYAGAVAWANVIRPRLVTPILTGQAIASPLIAVPLLLTLLLFLKISPRTSRLGNISMAVLVGIGAAVAVGGAVLGTLFPQTQAAMASSMGVSSGGAADATPPERLFDGFVLLVGTVSTLVYFHFGARPNPGHPPARPYLVAPVAFVGQMFIAITFGAMYAGALAASVAILSDRLQFLWGVASQILKAAGRSG